MTLYKYNWLWESDTESEVEQASLALAGKTINDVVQEAKDAAQQQAIIGLTQMAQEQGLTLSNIVANSYASYTSRTEYGMHIRIWYKLHVHVSADFNSDQSLIGSPIAPALLLVIKWIIDAVVISIIAYFAIQAVQTWLMSMTTKTSTIRKYDANGNLISEEDTTGPSTEGIAMLGTVAVAFGLTAGGIILLDRALAPRPR